MYEAKGTRFIINASYTTQHNKQEQTIMSNTNTHSTLEHLAYQNMIETEARTYIVIAAISFVTVLTGFIALLWMV